ncbi:hypothetical protein BU24DRAFT_426863 [Aaosphaeria arxii CBS 175.79]|uniref:N-acetyltransferase domain-containing protein n=1 Tax=Aaosphaeria arxii CBS 175.79 TaxID=1450172 RepID=A0A6A5XEU7_9PLEO|nr:uncharacterized protein BU24DRAFT_426863 [Aaosphaeria arxii CBS 175.79]KAF2011765.1 hypothetical protein BU24DRAFT_426863 [Aaosphaeria arxii CBS 175.79]
MPAMLEDPTAPIIYRTSGDMPYPVPGGVLPLDIGPRQVTLRDRITIATIIPFSSPAQIPISLLAYLCDQFGREIETGQTYPMEEPMSLEAFGPYWFGVFGAVILLGDISGIPEIHRMAQSGNDWERACLGSFYIKPNYPGRSSHVCNGGFLVTDGARNRGVGRLMGETYLDWAPKLGYTYSVFNLVYETNTVSCRIWDALGFKRIGRVKGCGRLKGRDQLVDAIIYGRDLGEDDTFVSEERFDKIRFYLRNGKYPNNADRAEKSRLRSAATHYKLIPAQGDIAEKLVLKGKEVISEPQRQYEIARDVHHRSHGGINKTTAAIAEQYHWVRIKETVSQVIRNCPECSEMNKGLHNSRTQRTNQTPPGTMQTSSNNVHPMEQVIAPLYGNNSNMTRTREESPGQQLQLEAAQHSNAFSNDCYMPVDPALMESLDRSQATGIGDMPSPVPSPFLSAGSHFNGRPTRQQRGATRKMTDMNVMGSNLPAPMARMTAGESMVGMEERAPTVREELRRRITRFHAGR